MRLRFLRSLWKQREVLWRLSEREVLGRYRGSMLGLAWSFIQPLSMLAVYTFIFTTVFQARWGINAEGGSLAFAINLFAGLIVFNLLAECLSKAPTLILANPNYVKKVIFPLETLAFVNVAGATFHAGASLVVLFIFELIAFRRLPITLVWLPLVWAPLLLGSLAATWVLSALGVYLRDIGQVIGVVVSMLMFLSPIFYPISALPPRWQAVLSFSPLTHIIEQTRRVLVAGTPPSAGYLVLGTLLSLLAAEIAFRAFEKSRKGFADVL
jgi:lipopolysaccharide transport system permease protein